jgi:single-strand DNA-binding protein
MALPNVSLVGRITAEPNLRFTNNGKPWCTVRVACNDRKKDANGNWVDGESVFIDITVWRAAESVSRLAKGAEVLVVGTLRQRDYETKEGEKRSGYEIVAEYIGSALRDANNNTTGFAPVASSTDSDLWATPMTATDGETPF